MPAEDGQEYTPKAAHWGDLSIGGREIPCYVLNTGDRVFSLKGIVVGLIGTEGGQLSEYLKVKALQPHLPQDLMPAGSGDIPALFRHAPIVSRGLNARSSIPDFKLRHCQHP